MFSYGTIFRGRRNINRSIRKYSCRFKILKLNHSKYSFLLNNDGGIIDDLIVTKKKKDFV